MPIRIENESMSSEANGRVVATARFNRHAAADGLGAWVVSCCPGRLLTRSQAITVLTVEYLLAVGYVADDPHVAALREELR